MTGGSETLKMIVGAVDQASGTLKGISSNLENVTSAGDKMKAALSVAAVGFSLGKMVEMGQESASAMERLKIGVEGLGGNFEKVRAQVDGIVASQEGSAYAPGDMIESLGVLTQKTGSYEKALGALPTVMNVAAATGMSLEGASSAISRALEGNTMALQSQFPWMRKMKEEGKGTADIMDELGKMTEGAAAKMGQVQGLTRLKNVMGDVAEAVGEFLLPVMSAIAGVFEKFGAANIAVIAGFIMFIGIVIKLPAMLTAVRVAVLALNTAMAANPVGLVITLIGALVAAFIILWNKFAGFRAFWMTSWDVIKAIAMAVIQPLIEYVRLIAVALQAAMAVIQPLIEYVRLIAVALQALMTALSNPFDAAGWKAAATTIKNDVVGAFGRVVGDFANIGRTAASSWSKNYKEQLAKDTKNDALVVPVSLGSITTDTAGSDKLKAQVSELNKQLASMQNDAYAKAKAEAAAFYADAVVKYKGNSEAILVAAKIRDKMLEDAARKHESDIRSIADETKALKNNEEQAELSKLAQWYDDQLLLHEQSEEDKVAVTELYTEKRKKILEKYNVMFQAETQLVQQFFNQLATTVGNTLNTILTFENDALAQTQANQQLEIDAIDQKYATLLANARADKDAVKALEEQKAVEITAIQDKYAQSIADKKKTADAKAYTEQFTLLGRLKKLWEDFTASVINMVMQIVAKLLLMKFLMAMIPGGSILGVGIPKLFGFQTSYGETKTIPGPPGMPVPIMAHGQEIIGRPSGGSGGGNAVTVMGDVFGWDEAMERVRNGLYTHQRRTGLAAAF